MTVKPKTLEVVTLQLLAIIERIMSKAHDTTLTLGLFQQQAHMTSHVKGRQYDG